MTERQLQFRVGLFVIASCAAAGFMVFQFGSMKSLWEKRYSVAIRFDTAPNVYPATPVRRNGITIGKVTDVVLDDQHGGVIVLVEIKQDVRLRDDAEPRLVRSLLGDASIEFSGGKSNRYLQQGATLRGEPPADPMEMFTRLEEKTSVSLETFNATAREWQRVGRNINSLTETNRGNLDTIIERTAVALDQFNATMKKADAALVHTSNIVGDPENQANLKKTLAELPTLVKETKDTIGAVRLAVGKADQTLGNLKNVTEPLAEKSTSIVTKLDNTLGHLESASRDFNEFSAIALRDDGTLRQFASDPELYRNLNKSAESLSLLLQNLQPIIADAQILADKLARHPELLGVGGAMKGSTGLKDPPGTSTIPPSRQATGPYRPRN